LSIYIVAIAVFATLVFAVSSIYGRYLIFDTENSYHFYLYQTIVSFLLFFLINVLLIGLNIIEITPISLYNSYIIILSSMFAFIGFLTLFRGFEVGDVSVGGVFLSSRVLVSVPLAVLVIGEIFPIITYLFIFITLIGALLASYQSSFSLVKIITFRASGTNWFIITLIFWAVSNTLVRELNNEVYPLFFLLIRSILFVFLGIITFPLFNRLLAKGKKMKINYNIVVNTIFYAIILIIAQTSFVYALGENLTIAEGVGILEGVFTVILVISLYKTEFFKKYLFEATDFKTLSIRITGVILAFLGAAGAISQIIV
jgi:drug/metabolite transporter (DMT)-like permease